MLTAGVVACVLIVFRTTAIALLQALAPPRMRGRVLAIFEIVFWGINPVGGLLGGIIADRLGATALFLVFGAMQAVALIAAAIIYGPLPSLDIDRDGHASTRGHRAGFTPPLVRAGAAGQEPDASTMPGNVSTSASATSAKTSGGS